jgi:hypothetical protein
MSIPTGKVYLQVYNEETNKYVELPSSVGSISFVKIPTGLSSVNGYDANFSGFNISKSVKIDGSINISPINIGLGNVTGSGFRVINIGENNSNIFLTSGFITSGFYGGANIGVGNIGRDSTITFNIGSTNSSRENSHQVYNFGANNYVEDGFFINNIGISNSTITGNKVFNLGVSNEIYSGKSSFVIGIQNNVNLSNTLYAIGNSNNFQEANFNKSFGDGIDISGSSNVLNLGDDNVVYDSDQIIILNNDNNVLDSEAQTILGKNNVILNSTNNTVVGQYNSVESANTNLFGDQNITKGTGNYVYGNLNIIRSGNSNSSIYGTSNSMSRNDTSLILGYDNLVMSGIENFILGYGNRVISGGNSVVLGQKNQSLDINKSYIFGENNYVGEKANHSYVFGQNNFTSGDRNCIIGNNNVVRSGDNNSILIGINHKFTGDFNSNSISIASNNSRIEISPNEINFISNTTPKINGLNILHSPANGDTFVSRTNEELKELIFNDDDYVGLPDQINVSSFNYVKTVDTYHSPTLSGFVDRRASPYIKSYFGSDSRPKFVKKSISFHSGFNHSSLIDTFYESEKFIIMFSKKEFFSAGQWLMFGREEPFQEPLFINESQNSGVVPLNNWAPLTISEFSVDSSGVMTNSFDFCDKLLITGAGTLEVNGIYSRTGLGNSTFYGPNNFKIHNFNNIALGITLDEGDYSYYESLLNLTKFNIVDGGYGVNPAPTGILLSFGLLKSVLGSGSFIGENIKAASNNFMPINIFKTEGSIFYNINDDLTLFHGQHIEPKFNPTWLIADNFSSGVYFINTGNYDYDSLPQNDWTHTGYNGHTGLATGLSIKLSLGTRYKLISINDPDLGKGYIPVYY